MAPGAEIQELGAACSRSCPHGRTILCVPSFPVCGTHQTHHWAPLPNPHSVALQVLQQFFTICLKRTTQPLDITLLSKQGLFFFFLSSAHKRREFPYLVFKPDTSLQRVKDVPRGITLVLRVAGQRQCQRQLVSMLQASSSPRPCCALLRPVPPSEGPGKLVREGVLYNSSSRRW